MCDNENCKKECEDDTAFKDGPLKKYSKGELADIVIDDYKTSTAVLMENKELKERPTQEEYDILFHQRDETVADLNKENTCLTL